MWNSPPWLKKFAESEACQSRGRPVSILCLAGSVYKIWMERNTRIFKCKAQVWSQILEKTLAEIKMLLSVIRPVTVHAQAETALYNFWGEPGFKDCTRKLYQWLPPTADYINIHSTINYSSGQLGLIVRCSAGLIKWTATI